MTYISESRPMAAVPVDGEFAQIVRPFAWIAALFFATGFLGFFVVHPL